ncbi:elongation factor EF-2 [Candidatus Woesearchaeota archaeon]|nr:MAG: elongation factor EF-2 [Candidatus Woesearchaeota archaeon]RLE45029.1 MAG: elongation factor EF-2 [Candidatus Woesearchaeota archaeon]
MPTDEELIQKVKELMNKPAQIRNIGIAAHIDHGKTTLSDSLIAGAGMISEAVAGERLILDFAEDEQLRGITIDAANCSMVHSYEGKEYLINLIDTPGHVDFGGDVTRAMRAVDGAVVLVCAVEGMMPQTETVLRQALKERVKPVLFINKVDRLIKELKLTPEQMQERFIKIITGVNKFIARIAPPEFKEKWQVSVQDGSVAFGSAYHKWALSLPYMQKHNITFKDIIEAYQTEIEWKKLFRKAPLHQIILDMVIKHLPNPVEAQRYRIPKIWHGDLDSEVGKALLNCSPDGPAAFVVTKIVVDPHAGEIASGRLFSGVLQKGQEVFMNMAKRKTRIQNLYIYKGPTRIPIDKAVAGNIIGIAGLKGVYAGETVSSIEMEPFEALKHLFEPVVTKAVEAAKPSDLPKLIEVLKTVAKEDPSIQVEINEETGEHLLHGMGELHLEVIENRIRTKKGVDIKTSPPIVVYRETVLKRSPEVEGKSPNKHNKFYIVVEPLEDSIYQGIKEGEIPEMRVKKKDMALLKALEAKGMSSDDARKVRDIYKGNILMDMTRGIVHIGEVIEMVMDAFEQVMSAGPLAREPCTKIKVMLVDCKLHEDAIHRGPAQVIPAVRDAIKGAIMQARPVLFEPVQIVQFEAPAEFIGEISKIVQNRRGQMLEINQEEHQVTIKAKIPVGESFGLSNDLRSATQGRGAQFLVDQFFEKLPDELQMKIINQIRQRKGIKTE